MGGEEDRHALFFASVLAADAVWTVGDEAGVPAGETADGRRAMPFWSSPSRVARVRRTVPAYGALQPVRLSLTQWREQWLPGLERDGLLVALDQVGAGAGDEGVQPVDVEAALLAAAGRRPDATD